MIIGLVALGQPNAEATPLPTSDPFYKYTGTATQLAAQVPGTVLNQRTFTFQPNGVPTAYQGVQLLYRTTTELGKPAVTVTSVIKPAGPMPSKLISDQFFYDALDVKCDPSYFLSNGTSGGGTNMIEGANVASLLASGYPVVTSDYEGEDLAWTAGPQSGMQTLDGIRAALNSTVVGLPANTKVGILGYSGGAIASEWASELAKKYAPDVSSRIVGTAIGGIYVYPAHNLRYVSGTPKWSGVTPGALLGVTRGFGINLNTYASAYGKKLSDEAKTKCIDELLSKHPGLTFAQLVKPQYAKFENVPAFVKLNNKLIMSSGGTPAAPMYMGQGLDTTGQEMTPSDKPGIGPGDGVMIAGDVRTLARTYCGRGVSVQYQEYLGAGHTAAFVPFFSTAVAWLTTRFAGTPADGNCSSIALGNSLAPLPTPTTKPARPGSNSVHHARANSANSVHHATPALGGAEIAATGADSRRLLLWALLLVGLGGAVQWAGTVPRPRVAPKRPLPGRRRPLPYPRP